MAWIHGVLLPGGAAQLLGGGPKGDTIKITQFHPGILSGRRYGSFANKGGGTTYPQAVSDTVGFTEALVLQVGKVLAEAPELTEAQVRQVAKILAETAGLTEALANQGQKG